MASHSIREIALTDASWIYESCQDEQIQYWTTIPRPYLLEHAESFVKGEFPEYKIWTIEDENLQPVGVISIHSVNEAKVADIGYWVSPWGRGKGATKEALRLVENYAKNDPNIKALSACISDLNAVSRKIVESVGFKWVEVADHTCPAGTCQTSSSIFLKVI